MSLGLCCAQRSCHLAIAICGESHANQHISKNAEIMPELRSSQDFPFHKVLVTVLTILKQLISNADIYIVELLIL